MRSRHARASTRRSSAVWKMGRSPTPAPARCRATRRRSARAWPGPWKTWTRPGRSAPVRLGVGATRVRFRAPNSSLMKRIRTIAEEWRTALRPEPLSRAAAEGTAVGLLLGLIDVHSKQGDLFNAAEPSNLIAGWAILGLRHGVRAWQAWGPMGWCFYLMHRAAIGCGYRPPYVEEDADRGHLLSSGAHVEPVWAHRLRRTTPAGPSLGSQGDRYGVSPWAEPRRPFTIAAMMATVALIGVQLAALRDAGRP